jgi:hypothetical protein
MFLVQRSLENLNSPDFSTIDRDVKARIAVPFRGLPLAAEPAAHEPGRNVGTLGRAKW